HDRADPEHGRDIEPVGEQRKPRDGVRDRQAEHGDQRQRDAGDEHQQRRDGRQARGRVDEGTGTPPQRPGGRARPPRHPPAPPPVIPHLTVALAVADSVKPPSTPGSRGLVEICTVTVAVCWSWLTAQPGMLALMTRSSPPLLPLMPVAYAATSLAA